MLTNTDFLQRLFLKHQETPLFPPTSSVCKMVTHIMLLLFPEQTKNHFVSIENIRQQFATLEAELCELLGSMQDHLNAPADEIAARFMNKIPAVYDLLLTDIEAILKGDPAAKNEYEIVRAYPGFYAIAFYRIAHELHLLGIPLIPRVLTEFAHSKTGIDIHPGASIGAYFFIDHGTGITIGETATIGKYVKLYQGITLGALSVSKDMASVKRHPTIEDYVVIYSGATILGGETIIGNNSVIGGNVWLTNSVPPFSKVYHQAQIKINSATVE